MKNPSDFVAWMERAFLYVEGELLQRSAQESPSKICEEIVRDALVSGLKAAKPSCANSVTTEEDVPWNRALDITNVNAAFGKGRAKQHDVAFVLNKTVRLVAEVKWLKSCDPDTVMEDIWRLEAIS